LLKNGVGGSCGSKYRGRAVLLPMQWSIAAEPT
jgi:hypothetical protein